MLFSEEAVDDVLGALLAHSVKTPKAKMSKGHTLDALDIRRLKEAGVSRVVVARLTEDEVDENCAALQFADALAGTNIEVRETGTGRANLYATRDGLFEVDVATVASFNEIDTAATLATLSPLTPVRKGQRVATIKLIPFGVSRDLVNQYLSVANSQRNGTVRLREYVLKNIVFIQTSLPGTRESILDKTTSTLHARLHRLGGGLSVTREHRCTHTVSELAHAIKYFSDQPFCQILVVSTASSSIDTRDILPTAIGMSGGLLVRLGMPVEPGNLLVLGVREKIPIVGMPGCARSPLLNGFDWVLERIAADVVPNSFEIGMMGVGGLLNTVSETRFGQKSKSGTATKQAVSAVVLAAGLSRRMGTENKLLLPVLGEPLIRHVVRAVSLSQAHRVIVVTGHEDSDIRNALRDFSVEFVFNDSYEEGLGSSVRAAANVVRDEDAIMFCLGDMPGVNSTGINRLIDAYHTTAGIAGCRAYYGNNPGNPVLWAPECLPLLRHLEGDEGAKSLLQQFGDEMMSVDMGIQSFSDDVDTFQDYLRMCEVIE